MSAAGLSAPNLQPGVLSEEPQAFRQRHVTTAQVLPHRPWVWPRRLMGAVAHASHGRAAGSVGTSADKVLPGRLLFFTGVMHSWSSPARPRSGLGSTRSDRERAGSQRRPRRRDHGPRTCGTPVMVSGTAPSDVLLLDSGQDQRIAQPLGDQQRGLHDAIRGVFSFSCSPRAPVAGSRAKMLGSFERDSGERIETTTSGSARQRPDISRTSTRAAGRG
jgi:hypothetical protein